MKKIVTAGLLAALSLSGAGASEIWRNPTIFRVNKLPAHAEFTVHADRDAALKPLDLTNPWNSTFYQSLNGEWQFNWYGSTGAVPRDWSQPETSVTTWSTMPVPGVWQSNGFDKLYYLNTFIAYEYDWETGERAEGFREDDIEFSKATGWIPDRAQTVGCYRKWVDISADRLDGRAVLRIGAVEAGVQVYVNGQEVGYSQDSLTPAEFDISAWLKPGRNLVALKVFRWTDGSYMEVQDMIRFAGIYRDVFLRFDPNEQIRDVHFVGTPDATLKKVNAVYSAVVANHSKDELLDAEVQFELLEAGSDKAVKTWHEKVGAVKAGAEVTVSGVVTLKKMKLWSPDLPNMYTLLVTLKEADGQAAQVVRSDAGFRRFEDIDGNLHLNGNRYFIRGVNRHDHHPVYGRHVPLANMVRDVELMKQNNINTVRTSHYPNDERWLYLCNRYGIALIDEANVESHGFEDVPGNRPQWTAAAVDRLENMVRRDINNPAVFIWSLGNEQGWGWTTAFDAMYDRAKEIDPSRLVMCDRANVANEKHPEFNSPVRLDRPDVVTPMYRVFEKGEKRLEERAEDRRPFFMCEYRHAMGNAVGALKEVWDFFYANQENGQNGGCIWDWIDQGVEARDADGTVYYQYGGDWGDKESFMNFCLNGLVMADQSTTPKLAEVKKCYEPFIVKPVSLDDASFEVLNSLNQRGLDQFDTQWILFENGKPVQSGSLDLNAQPRETETFTVPLDRAAMHPAKEYMLRIAFNLKEATKWAGKGHEVTFSEFKLGGSFAFAATVSNETPTLSNNETHILVTTANGVVLNFDKSSGLLTSLKVKGAELLTDSPRERLFDNTLAWIDNLLARKWSTYRMKAYRKLDLDNIKPTGNAVIKTDAPSGRVVVSITNRFMSCKKAGYAETQVWTIHGSGQIEVNETIEPIGQLTDDTWIPRIGLRIPLKPSINDMTYYGKGPHGNYPDRCFGAWTAIHSTTVKDCYIPYAYPQDHGNREEVRWMKLSDAQGNGLMVIAPEPLSMSALPYTQDELWAATHTIDLPKTSTTTELRIAAKVTGIGNGSCGPITDKWYQTTADKTEYHFVLVPFSTNK